MEDGRVRPAWPMKMEQSMKMEEQPDKPRREDVCPSKKGTLDLDAARDRLAEAQGPEYWRSLEELAGSPDFQEMLHREFPKGASEWLDSVSRRGFLKLMGASLAMAGMSACTKQPLEPIVPYVKQPEEVVPGRPLFFATAFTLGGYASPVLVESHLYRPTKIEGNDQHPASLGGTDIFSQASILGMYDPDRSQTVTYLGDIRSWGSLVEAMRAPLNIQKGLQGAGIRILTPTDFLAHAGRPVAVVSQGYPAGQVACVRAGQPRQRARRRQAGVRAAGGDALRLFESRRNPLARCRLPVRRLPRLHALCPRFRQAPQSRRWRDEPAVCGGEHAEFDGREGRPPVAGAGG